MFVTLGVLAAITTTLSGSNLYEPQITTAQPVSMEADGLAFYTAVTSDIVGPTTGTNYQQRALAARRRPRGDVLAAPKRPVKQAGADWFTVPGSGWVALSYPTGIAGLGDLPLIGPGFVPDPRSDAGDTKIRVVGPDDPVLPLAPQTVVATPLPPAFLFLASGIGLFGMVRRRRIGN